MKKKSLISRRQLLQRGSAALFPLIVPSSVFGAAAPSNRIVVGMIGMGRQCVHANLPAFLTSDYTQVTAVCDVDEWRLKKAQAEVDRHYSNKDCKAFRDWRDIVAMKDIDAVMVSTPDHWHVPISLAAVRAGKHVSCEKPLTMSIAEGRVLADAVKEKGVVFRTDSECRSNAHIHRAAELVVNGYIGKLKHVVVAVPTIDEAGGNPGPAPVPEGLDYDMWLGPAPMQPYSVDRVHPVKSYDRPGWMRCRDTCEGAITNWGAHLLDVLQLVHGSERTGPTEIEGSGEYPAPGSGLWNVLVHFNAQLRYADGVTVDFHTGDAPFIRYDGEDGWIQSTWFNGKDFKEGLSASSETLRRTKPKEGDIRLPQRMDKEDFIYGIRTGNPVMADAEVGHRTCSMGQLAHIAIQVGRKLTWNPDTERFAEDDEANIMLNRPIRGNWLDVTT